jgi:hypothetical protein
MVIGRAGKSATGLIRSSTIMAMNWRHHAAAGGLIFLAIICRAADTPPATRPAGADPVPAAVLAALDSDHYQVRESATFTLLGDDHLTPQGVFRAYAGATSGEQHHRLLEVARHHFIRALIEHHFAAGGGGGDTTGGSGGAGCLGVQIEGHTAAEDPQLSAPAAAITAVMPGFPCYALLRPGDLILAVAGQRFNDADNGQAIVGQLRERVMQVQAGQTITLTVSRGGASIQVPCKLGSMAALEALYPHTGPEVNTELAPPFNAMWEKFAHALESAGPGTPAPQIDWDQLDPGSP